MIPASGGVEMFARRIRIVLVSLALVAAAVAGVTALDLGWNSAGGTHAAADLGWNSVLASQG
jgi:hypothetical protein